MATFSLEYTSIEELYGYNVLVTEFDNQSEQRRLKTASPVRGFVCTSDVLTLAQMQEHTAFFAARSGALDTFSFVSPFDAVTYTVRFVPDTFRVSYSAGAFNVAWEFKVIV